MKSILVLALLLSLAVTASAGWLINSYQFSSGAAPANEKTWISTDTWNGTNTWNNVSYWVGTDTWLGTDTWQNGN